LKRKKKNPNAQAFFVLFVFFLIDVYNNNIVVPRATIILNCIFTATAGARRDGAVIISVMSGRLKAKGKRKK